MEKIRKKCAAYMGCFWCVVLFVLLLLAAVTMGGCRSVKYVPVVEHHTETIVKRDSVISRDTIIDQSQVIVREVDSATMAKYGIQLKDMQRAWLIESSRLQKQISELLQSHADTVTVRDSIPYPVPVTEYVEKQLSWWQQTRLHLGEALLVLLAVVAGICVWKLYQKFRI